MLKKLLIVEDDRPLAKSLAHHLADFEPIIASSPEEAMTQMAEHRSPVILLDLGFPDDVQVGLDLLGKFLSFDPCVKMIVMTGFGSREVGVRAVERGAYAYLEKPLRDFQAARVILQQAFQIYELEREIEGLRKETSRFGLIGTSPGMERVFRQIGEIAPTKATVLIEGESGTGKELVARAIHEASGRRGPFIVLDCTTLTESLAEDKLFGHERGAFTGAMGETKGAIEAAEGGTLFLDEVGELPLPLQPKFLRLLQEKSFQRIGSHETRHVDVRLLAATSRDLKKEVQEGRFREELYWRLQVHTVAPPPLRERREDLPPLVAHFLKKHSGDYGKAIRRVAPAALASLSGYEWPGNVRELENLIQRSLLVANGPVLLPEHISPFAGKPVPLRLSELESEWKGHWIREALARQGGDLAETAQELGISKRQLQRYTKEFGIDWKKFLTLSSLLLLLFCPRPASSGSLTLDDLVARALQARPELEIATTQREEAEGYALKARSASLPRLDLSSTYLRLDQNPEITLNDFQTEATIDMRPVKREFPVLGAGPDQVKVPVTFDETRLPFLGTDFFSNAVTLRQPLFAGGRIRAKKREAALGRQIADLNLEVARRQVKVAVKEEVVSRVVENYLA